MKRERPSRWGLRGRAAILAPAALSVACAGARADGGARGTLGRVFAAHAAEVVGGDAGFAATIAGFERETGASLRATLPARGEGAIRLETARGLTVEVREEGAAGEGTLDGAAVAYERPGGTSWWRAASGGDGVEEWLLLERGASAAWEIRGGTPRQAGAAIEIDDDAGVARLRVTAPAAYAASGQRVGVRLQARGQRVELAIDDAPSGPLLVDPTWTPTGAMSVAREAHTATLLPDGRVLVAGGTGAENYATAEIYDPSAALFLPTASMAAPRVHHFAVLLGTGQVLAAGGDGLSTAEVFDPTAQTWTMVGPLAQVRTQAAGAILPGGEVLLTGGDGASADLYDPAMEAWTAAAPMHVGRSAHSATLLADGTVLVAGGITQENGSDVTTSAAEIYDPAADAWTDAAPLLAPRALHTASALPDGRVLVAGGTAQPGPDSLSEVATAEIYDPTSKSWQAAPAMASGRAEHTATTLASGAVLVTGGLDPSDSALPTAELFAPDTGQWVSLAPMTATRILHTATLLADGTVLVAGGEQQSSAEIFATGAPGAPCSLAAQCQSGYCVDGVCCTSACSAACHSCALPAAPGTCTPASAGTDPRSDCGDGGACDFTCAAGGTCASRAGTACTPGGCGSDGASQFPAASCVEGLAACPIDVEPCAAGYRCDADAGACRAECRSLADCAAGYACDPSGRCVLPPEVASGDAPSCSLAALPGGAASGASALLAGAALGGALRRRRRRGRRRT